MSIFKKEQGVMRLSLGFVILVTILSFCVWEAKTSSSFAQSKSDSSERRSIFNRSDSDSSGSKRPLFFKRNLDQGTGAQPSRSSRTQRQVFRQPPRKPKSVNTDAGALLRASERRVQKRIEAEAARMAREVDRRVAQRQQRLAAIQQFYKEENEKLKGRPITAAPDPTYQSPALPGRISTTAKPKRVYEKEKGYQKPKRIFNFFR